MVDCYIYDAVRTPRGKGRKDGGLHEVTPVELASEALRHLRDRNCLNTGKVDDVVLGCVSPVLEQGGNIGRIAVMNAGYDQSVAGVQINRFCGSGLEAVNMAAAQVMSGQSDMTIGGGVESMSRVPMGADGGSWALNPTLAHEHYFTPQGVSADLIATLEGFSRKDVDAYAVESQRRANHAWAEGYFDKSVVPVRDINGLTILARDEHLRPGASMESMAILNPSFEKLGAQAGYNSVAIQRYPEVESINHVHHPGNSSGIVDGAAAVLLGSKDTGDALGLKPRARIRGFSSIGTEPCIMLTGPADVSQKALKRCGMAVEDIDLYELNEAFASVVLRMMKVLAIPQDKMNVNGGAIAMGHPLGATGAMLIGTLLDELERRDLETGLATLCVGAGMGTATIIERV
jgi:acetyl-CoA C-acetyltransferase